MVLSSRRVKDWNQHNDFKYQILVITTSLMSALSLSSLRYCKAVFLEQSDDCGT